MKNALGANIILAQKSPQSGVIGVIGVYIWNHPILGCFYKESCINSTMSSMDTQESHTHPILVIIRGKRENRLYELVWTSYISVDA